MEKKISETTRVYTLNRQRAEEKAALKERLNRRENEISLEELLALARRIKPVCRFDGTHFNAFFRGEPETEGLFFIEPLPIDSRRFYFGPQKVLKAEGLRYLCSADTYHDYFCPTIVKPTVKEVLCQLPEEVCGHSEEVVAFEVVLPALDLSLADPALKRHVLVTHFFTGVLPEEIRRQPVLVGEKRY